MGRSWHWLSESALFTLCALQFQFYSSGPNCRSRNLGLWLRHLQLCLQFTLCSFWQYESFCLVFKTLTRCLFLIGTFPLTANECRIYDFTKFTCILSVISAPYVYSMLIYGKHLINEWIELQQIKEVVRTRQSGEDLSFFFWWSLPLKALHLDSHIFS